MQDCHIMAVQTGVSQQRHKTLMVFKMEVPYWRPTCKHTQSIVLIESEPESMLAGRVAHLSASQSLHFLKERACLMSS